VAVERAHDIGERPLPTRRIERTYVFGSYQSCKKIGPTGEICTQSRQLPQPGCGHSRKALE
jgi:hypothetical protein